MGKKLGPGTGMPRNRTSLILALAVTAAVVTLGLCMGAVYVMRQEQQTALAQSREITPEPKVTGVASVQTGHPQPSDQAINIPAPSPTTTYVPEVNVATVTPVPLRPWQGTQRLNILLLGIDQRPGENAAKSNTDTMIVITVDPATHTAGMLSIPRDLYVTLPDHSQGRINTAQALGGPAYAEQAVSALLGIPIQHYVRVNFTAFTKLIDLVGGIDVYVDQNINDPTYPNMSFGFDPFVISKGWHHMDGATALKYARTRHQSSDFVRMQRQQQILLALRDRVLSSGVLPDLFSHAPAIMNTLHDSIATDLDLTEVLRLLLYSRSLPRQDITHLTIDEQAAQPWTTPTGGAVLLPNYERIHQLVEKFIHPPLLAGYTGHSLVQPH